MAEGGANNHGGDRVSDEEWEKMKSIRRIQELFHGRFTNTESCALLRHNEWDTNRTVVFIFEASPDQLREILGENEWQVVDRARRNNGIIDNARRNRVPFEFRQFGCNPCDHMWWAKVPSRKMISRCKICKQKLDAIPRDLEWGWAQFQCGNCGNEFHGFGAMSKSTSMCYQCRGQLCEPLQIYPPLKNERQTRNRRYRHSCTAPNCYNRTLPREQMEHLVNICVHPKSLVKKVLEPSTIHESTGSSVKTFLSQNELQSPFDEYEPSLADIDEVRGNDGDNF